MENLPEMDFLAMLELQNGNEPSAQKLLRDSIKNNPSCISFNNLGVYYTQYGMIQKNGTIRSAKRIGLRYLIKAAEFGVDWRNYASIATALFDENAVADAYQWFSKAYELSTDICILYNIGVCLFRLGDYQRAAEIFESLCDDISVSCIMEANGQNPYLILAYCQYKLNMVQNCIDSIRKFREIWIVDDRFDTFCLRFLCGLFGEALSECRELLDEWYPTTYILAMIVECMIQVPSFTFTLVEAELPITKHTWHLLWTNKVFRKKKIDEYTYIPPAICMYHFIK